MRQIIIVIISILLITFLFSCTTTVELTIKNDEEYSQSVRINIEDKEGKKSDEISIGEVNGNDKKNYTFDIKNGFSFSVFGLLPHSAVIYRGDSITVSGKPDPFKPNVTLKNQSNFLDDEISLNTLSTSFKDMGIDIGAAPLDLQNALETRIGAVVVAIPREDNKTGRIILTVPPNILGVYIMNFEDINFPHTRESDEISISGNAAANLNASFGPIAQFGFNFHRESIYQMKWILNGFGQIVKKENELKPMVQFEKLPITYLNRIAVTLKDNPGSKIYYINKAYVLRTAELVVKEGQRVEVDAPFNASNVVSGGTAYSFEKSRETRKSYGLVILNHWGEEWAVISDSTTTMMLSRTPPFRIVPTGKEILLSPTIP